MLTKITDLKEMANVPEGSTIHYNEQGTIKLTGPLLYHVTGKGIFDLSIGANQLRGVEVAFSIHDFAEGKVTIHWEPPPLPQKLGSLIRITETTAEDTHDDDTFVNRVYVLRKRTKYGNPPGLLDHDYFIWQTLEGDREVLPRGIAKWEEVRVV